VAVTVHQAATVAVSNRAKVVHSTVIQARAAHAQRAASNRAKADLHPAKAAANNAVLANAKTTDLPAVTREARAPQERPHAATTTTIKD
jgi:hypothetical protein